MSNNKDKEGSQQQTAGSKDAHINPFRDDAPAEDPQQRKEEEIALEQQRKEALTERD